MNCSITDRCSEGRAVIFTFQCAALKCGMLLKKVQCGVVACLEGCVTTVVMI